MTNNTDHLSETAKYSKIYRWLGLCIDYYASSEEDDDKEIAASMRKDPSYALEALIEIRMALIAFKMTNVTHDIDGNHNVSHDELNQYVKKFPPKPEAKWWKVWIRYFDVMEDSEWFSMWVACDRTIEEMLSSKSTIKQTPSLFN